MTGEYIFSLNKGRLPEHAGGKAFHLRTLMDKAYAVPETYVCTWQAYIRYLDSDPSLREDLRSELSEKIDPGKSYAVRSSANIEDHVNHSFAGQFKSFLDVSGLENVLDAIEEIWDNARSPEVELYFATTQVSNPEILMGIVIQEMVTPLVSGVSFSKNPITGLDEVIVEALQGNGAALVQDGITPHRWIYKWGEWISLPGNGNISQDLIAEVVEQTKNIANTFGKPADLEWAYDGDTIFWLQLREISSLENLEYFSNKIAQDVLPGMIKPLIWSINIPLVNEAWVRLFTQVIGPNHIDPLSLAKSFYYRAYFNMGVIGDILELVGMPRETLELLMGIEESGPDKPRFRPSTKTFRLLPRIIVFAVQMLFKSAEIEKFPAGMKAKYLVFQESRIDQLDDQAILMHIDRLYALNQETAYYNIITPLLMQTYNAILKKQLAQEGVDFASFDLASGLDELHEVDPNYHLEKLADLYNQLNDNQKQQYDEASYTEFIEMQGCESLQEGVHQFIEDFGHLSDSGNDFSYMPWRENPDLILKMIKTNAEIVHDLQNKPGIQDIDAGFFSGIILKIIHQKARQYFLFREKIGSLYTFGYGLFRKYFLALGERFKVRGVLEDEHDIFYMCVEEIRGIISDSDQHASFAGIISQRKKEMEIFRNIIPPTIIYGDEPLPVEEVSGTILEGTPTSRGYYQGPAKIVTGIDDFERIQEGDVLVVPYSDVGWTPMYVKAGAVVAESGGLLSHSSIVAREYGIPAVVSVPGACKLLSGKVITVDGYRGKITIHESPSSKIENH